MNFDWGIVIFDFSKYYVNNFYNFINLKGLVEIICFYLILLYYIKDVNGIENVFVEEYVVILKKVFINDDYVYDDFMF